MSSYAGSDSGMSFGALLIFGIVLAVVGMIIYGAIIPQNVVNDVLTGKSSSLNNDNDSQKCRDCGTTYDVIDGYCATCRIRRHKEHKDGQ